MAFKLVVFFAALAYANAGYINQAVSPLSYAAPVAHAAYAAPYAASYAAPYAASYAAPYATPYSSYAPAAVGATHQSVVRGLGGASAVSHYTKAVDSPFSSVRKYDTRVTNGAVYSAPVAHAAYAAPAYSAYAAAPIAHAAYAAPAYSAYAAAPIARAAYAAPAYGAYAAAPIARAAYAAPAYGAYAAAPIARAAYAAPAYGAYAAAPVVARAGLAYSPASVVSHSTFSGYGVNYGW